MLASSYPRLKLYTKPSRYARIGWEMLTTRWRRGDDVERLEREIETLLPIRHAIAMPMARTAIYHAVKAVIRPGDKVILSPYTIVDVVNMVVCAGGVPVFADLEPGGCNLSADQVKRLLDGDTRAVLVTHFYGEACEIERIAALCAKKKVALIEDAAQAYGVKVNGRFVGTFGEIGVFSFGLYKNVNAFYGGMLVTSRDDVAQSVRAAIANYPLESAARYLAKVAKGLIVDIATWPPLFRSLTFWIFRYAYLNDVKAITQQFKIDYDPKMIREMPADYLRRMTPLQARLIRAQLNGVERAQTGRILNAKHYDEGLKNLPGLTLPRLRTDGSHGYYYYCIQYPEREKLVRYASLHGRDIQESYHRNCAELSCFGNYQRDCPNAEIAARSVIYLPVYPSYPAREIDRTVEVIKRFFREESR